MSRKRSTIDRDVVVTKANAMIEHLAASGTHVDQVKREAIISVVSSILIEGNSYHGYRCLNDPVILPDGERVWDDTRIALY